MRHIRYKNKKTFERKRKKTAILSMFSRQKLTVLINQTQEFLKYTTSYLREMGFKKGRSFWSTLTQLSAQRAIQVMALSSDISRKGQNDQVKSLTVWETDIVMDIGSKQTREGRWIMCSEMIQFTPEVSLCSHPRAWLSNTLAEPLANLTPSKEEPLRMCVQVPQQDPFFWSNSRVMTENTGTVRVYFLLNNGCKQTKSKKAKDTTKHEGCVRGKINTF